MSKIALYLSSFYLLFQYSNHLFGQSPEWYAYKNQWINLATLEVKNKSDFQPQTDFKTNHPLYQSYFGGLAIDKLAYKTRFFEIQPNNGLKLTNLRTDEEFLLENPDSKIQALGQHFLFAANDGICYVKHLIGKAGYKIYKFNLAGEKVFEQTLQHTEDIKKADLEYSRQFLQYLSHTPWEIIFTAYESTQQITYALDLTTGFLEELPYAIKGVILEAPKEEATERKHYGFLSFDAQNVLNIHFRQHGAKSMPFNLPNINKYNTLEGLLKDNILIITAYNRAQTGAHLYAIDLNKKSLIWETALDNKNQANENFHKIWLSHYANKLIIEENKSTGRDIHVFDFVTGSSVFSSN